jgi:signal peptidase I
MTLFAWFVFFLAIQIVHYLGTWKLYEKAGRKSWEAAIPIYNSIVLMKIINRPSWWTILLFIPVINLIMFPVVWVETIRSFGKKSAFDTILVLVTLGLYIYYINYTQNVTHIKDRSLISSSKAGDTISSLLFAIVVATLVHTYVMQPYTIPTSSLEKSLLVGDFLFVSKFHYGARIPMTTVAAPMVHDTLPLVNKKSYTIWPQLPYFRLPGFENIKNSDIVVFNWPADTLYHMYRPADKRYEKPIDKKTNYVKRCVGIPGDNLSIKDGIVYINDKELQLPERAKPQYSYWLGYDGKTPIDFDFLLKDMKVTDGIFYVSSNRDSIGIKALTKENSERLKNIPGITSVTRLINKGAEDGIYPDPQDGIVSKTSNWNCDNFGPIYIPKAGVTVALDLASLPLYKKIITEYEKGNVLKVVGNDIYINDKIVKSYTFQQNYYWMMGDNRHNSLDARYFGFTPEDHIVGKPVFIWMSWDSNGKGFGKIRWDRLFTTVGGDGQPTSYFKIFLILLALYIAIDYGIKKRNAKKNS